MVTPGPEFFPLGQASALSPHPLRQPHPLLTTSVLGVAAGTHAPLVSRCWFSYTSSSTWLLLISVSRRSLGEVRPEFPAPSPELSGPWVLLSWPRSPSPDRPTWSGRRARHAGWVGGQALIWALGPGTRLQWLCARLSGLPLTGSQLKRGVASRAACLGHPGSRSCSPALPHLRLYCPLSLPVPSQGCLEILLGESLAPQDVREVGAAVQPLLPPLAFILGLVLILGWGGGRREREAVTGTA